MKYVEKWLTMVVEYAPRLVLGLLLLYFGFKLVNRSMRIFSNVLQRNNFDADLRPFLITLLSVLLKMLLLLSAAELIGIETTSFVAILAAAGFAVGFALQGSLSNFAGGILILFFKHFRTGDMISAEGHIGVVDEIQILYTVLITLNRRRIIIPNSLLSNGVIENITGSGIVRVDLTFGIAYSDDIDKARSVIRSVIDGCPYAIVDEKYPHDVLVKELGDNSVNFAVWVWAESTLYWETFFFMQEYIKKAFDREGISIPFPQRDIHLHREKPIPIQRIKDSTLSNLQ